MLEQAPVRAATGDAGIMSKIFADGFLARCAYAYRVFRNRMAVRDMRDFDDAQLADIGLCRSDVEQALMVPAGVDPSIQLIRARRDELRGRRHP
jgi:uncharacterized protein YjiS (DUF1127 family)